MANLIMHVDNPDDEALLRALAKRLNVPVELDTVQLPTPDVEGMIRALDKLTASGSFDYITDPVQWQRAIRQDRPLPFRDDE